MMPRFWPMVRKEFVQMRRDQVMIKNEFQSDLQKPFRGIETNGNPWNLAASDRASWADGMGIPLMSEKPDAKVLYWVGCAASYDDRAKKIARATCFAAPMITAGCSPYAGAVPASDTRRYAFSTITMDASTSTPIANSRPPSDMMLDVTSR